MKMSTNDKKRSFLQSEEKLNSGLLIQVVKKVRANIQNVINYN